MRHRPLWSRIGVAATIVATAFVGLAVPAQAAEPLFQVPFPCGQTWTGDNPASSRHRTPWEIDFNRGDDEGMPVLAAAAGTVATAADQGNLSGFGNLVKIQHGSSGYFTYYAHLNDMPVSRGQSVAQEQLIGWVGNTSSTSPPPSPHLHYEVRYGSAYPEGIRPAVFDGVRFPYPSGSVTSRNCGGGGPRAKPAKSVNGDKYDDALGIDASGVASVYHGNSGGGFDTAVRLGPGWGGFSRVAVNDANADGWADLWAVDGGTLKFWRNRGNGSFAEAATVGSGWTSFENIAFGDVNGDNKTDVLARDGGYLYLYVGRGTGSFASRIVVGSGWASLPRHTIADADGDGDGDLWATNSAGQLYFWKRGAGGYATAVDVGGGWNAFRQVVAMDVNGDGKGDLVGIRTADDTLWQWIGTGSGTFGQGMPIGNGWAGHDLAVN